MQVTTTPRGHQRISCADSDGNHAILEQTGGMDYANPTFDEPGTSFVLLGRKDAPVKLDMEQVAELVGFLQTWLEEGQFAAETAAVPSRERFGKRLSQRCSRPRSWFS